MKNYLTYEIFVYKELFTSRNRESIGKLSQRVPPHDFASDLLNPNGRALSVISREPVYRFRHNVERSGVIRPEIMLG